MLKNYLIIAWRSLRKHFTYSLINVLGLSLGFATFILLSAWIRHELSYDQFHQKSKQIYRGGLEYSFGGQTSKTSVSPTALLPTMQKNFAEVENGVRVYNPSAWNPFILRKDEKLFQEGKFYYADSAFFDVFSFQLIKGNPDKVLTEPNSVVLTQSMAKKYFGEEDPIGQLLQINNRTDYRVTGLMEDVPTNSHLQFDFIASFSSLPASKEQIWWSANYQTFILVKEETDIADLSQKTNDIVKKALASELTNPGDYAKYNFMPLSDIYLRSDVDESEVVGNIQYVYLFGLIALLIVVIACINYVNLATARAADRAKEVGIRKVVGALKNQLFFQFIGESMIITFISFFAAFLLAQLGLTGFNMLTGKSFHSIELLQPEFIAICFLTAIVVALIAGAYPALAITAFKPVSILKGNFRTSAKGIWLRQTLVVFQFSISIVLIVGTLIILKQVNFIQNKRLGYEKENVLVLPLDRKTEEVYSQLKTELLRSGKAKFVARASESPTKLRGGYGISIEGGSDHGMITTATPVDEEFVPTMGMQIAYGRNFTEADSKTARADTTGNSYSFILNESALKELSIQQDKAIGTRVSLSGRKGSIVGVVKDFHFSSLHEKIAPLVLFIEEQQYSYIFIKLEAGDITQTLTSIKAICANVIPHRPFEYKFLDEQYTALYSSEQKIGAICSVFASLTIIIACLGLFGLVAFAASQKVKEIGIRKVLGATSQSIVLLITKDYSKLVILSILIGLPLAYYLIENFWLSEFAYRTDVGAGPFILSAAGCLLIAFGTASYQAIRASMIDPVNALRRE
ncbi:MAG TPA: ABC transporter permease [Cyclobacteriaceae bacterium]